MHVYIEAEVPLVQRKYDGQNMRFVMWIFSSLSQIFTISREFAVRYVLFTIIWLLSFNKMH